MVPKGWLEKSLSDITKWSSGGTPSKNNSEFWNGDIPWISAASMRGHYFSDSELKITALAVSEGAKIAPENSLLLLVRGSMLWNKIPVGIAAKKVAFNQDVKCIKPDVKKTNSEFLLYWFLTNEYHLMNMVTGTGIGAGKLDTTDLQNLEIILPPLPEQRKIAKILSTWDKAIATTERLIAISQQQKKALMQQLLTGKKRLVNPETGKVFEGDWEDTHTSEHINLLSGYAFKSSEFERNSNFKLLRGINISQGYLRWEVDQTYSWGDATDYKKYVLKLNDVVISMDGSLVGRNYAVITENNLEPMLLVQRVARLRCKSTLNHRFLLQHIASERFKSYVDSVKTVTAIPHISAKDIRQFPLLLPSIKEQQKIASVLTAADQEIERLEAKLAHLKDEKKALMQQLLTGKRRVKIDATEAA